MGRAEKKWMNTLCGIQNVHVIKDYTTVFTESGGSRHGALIDKMVGGYAISASAYISRMRSEHLAQRSQLHLNRLQRGRRSWNAAECPL